MAVGEALVQVRISRLQLWLVVLLFLSGWPQIGRMQPHSPPEVVIPLRVTGTSRGMRPPGWISYSLHFGGQKHILYMKAKKFLISRHLSVFTYTEQGALHENRPFVQNDCYYHGYVEGDPESLVALSTCFGGFRGTLQINNTAYEIKPKSLSTTFEHLVYKMDIKETQLIPMRCRLTEEEIARQLKPQKTDDSILMQSGYEGWWTHRWFLELALVVDHERFLYHERNTSNVVEEIFLIVNEINSLYFSLDIDVTLLGLEIWNKRNPLTARNIEDFLVQFCLWKSISLNSRIQNDIAHLFIQRNFGIYLGLAYVGSVCHPSANCGVDRIMGRDVYGFGHTVAHEMGHNLGMKHDDKECICGQKSCIMAPTENDSTRFSNCSYATLWETSAKTNCMRMAPKELHILKWQFCGNGVVEQGEQCDCGSLKLCAKDPCCLTSCTLKSGADCASGLCCKDCQFMPSGTVCREKNNECDLPEWCNGSWHECPEDVYVQHGTPCMGSGYCYEKRCNDRDEQCRQIFGQEARSATQSCYRAMNTRGDRFGNCGITSTTYVRCNISDVLCGRVQCENVEELPLLRNHSSVHYTHFNAVTCWGTDYHWGMTIPDVGEVKDGTGCGLEHVCVHRKCVRMPLWASACSPKTCDMKGVCNNKHHCHCHLGWEPPNCLMNGLGGSIDSGPPPGRIVGKRVHKRNYLWLLFLIPFGVLFFYLLICLWKRYKTSPLKEQHNVPTFSKNEDFDVVSLPGQEEQNVQISSETEGTNFKTSPEREK